MNKVQEQLMSFIKDVMRETLNNTNGEIVEFDNETMLAEVKIKNPNGAGMFKLKKVPVQIGSGGVSQAGPFIGDRVLVNFQNGNINNPVVVALIDTHHAVNFRDIREKHSRKGALCPDAICVRDGWEYSDPLYEDILNGDIF